MKYKLIKTADVLVQCSDLSNIIHATNLDIHGQVKPLIGSKFSVCQSSITYVMVDSF